MGSSGINAYMGTTQHDTTPLDNMKVLLLTVLLALLLCSTPVNMLKCYICEDADDDICKTTTTCPDNTNFCRTDWSNDQLSRTCEEFCIPSIDVECCDEDLCGDPEDNEPAE